MRAADDLIRIPDEGPRSFDSAPWSGTGAKSEAGNYRSLRWKLAVSQSMAQPRMGTPREPHIGWPGWGRSDFPRLPKGLSELPKLAIRAASVSFSGLEFGRLFGVSAKYERGGIPCGISAALPKEARAVSHGRMDRPAGRRSVRSASFRAFLSDGICQKHCAAARRLS